MKPFYFLISTLCLSSALLTSCSKKGEDPKPALTNCTGCKFVFTENADLSSDLLFTSGNYRVFWADINKNYYTEKVIIKAPMQGKSFKLNKSDIAAGKISVLDVCDFCSMIGMIPVDGTVKGENVTPNERADHAQWLIEAKIIRHAFNGGAYKDTVNIRQYFTANFVLN